MSDPPPHRNLTRPVSVMSKKRPADRESEPPLQWPKSLTIDSLIEALDVQNLWFPARVIQLQGSKVLLHFLGWSDEALLPPLNRMR